jgi:hypothetical protein
LSLPGRADKAVDDVDHRVFQHHLRCRRFVDALLRVRIMPNVLDAQNRIGIP